MRISTSTLCATVLTLAATVPFAAQSALAQGKSWWLDLEAGTEFDDNVAVEQNDDNSESGDIAAILKLDAGYKVVDEKDARVEIGYDFYQSLYQDLSAFNYQSHTPGFKAWIKPGGIKLGLEYTYLHSLLDDSFFLDQHMVSPTISAFLSDDFFVTAYYRFFDKDYNSSDDARDAQTHQTGADVYYYFDRLNMGYFTFGGGFTSEDTDGPAFDYDGFMGRTAVQVPVNLFELDGRVKFSYNYQKRNYDNVESLTPITTLTRSDDRHTLRLNTELEITDAFTWVTEFRNISRNSNLAASNYQENIGSVAFRYSF